LSKISQIVSFRLSGRHECLVPVTPWCAGLFEYLLENGKPRSKVRAADMRHVLRVLPSLLPDLLLTEVQEYNRQNPRDEPLVDPSSDCIDVTLLLLTWYRLFRRCDPPKDEEDINELQELAHWYLNLSKNI
jgi:hypothetical protein